MGSGQSVVNKGRWEGELGLQTLQDACKTLPRINQKHSLRINTTSNSVEMIISINPHIILQLYHSIIPLVIILPKKTYFIQNQNGPYKFRFKFDPPKHWCMEFTGTMILDYITNYLPSYKLATTDRSEHDIGYTFMFDPIGAPIQQIVNDDEKEQLQLSVESEGVGGPGAAADQLPLPVEWEKVMTEDGKIYYQNHVTKETSWVHPGLHDDANTTLY